MPGPRKNENPSTYFVQDRKNEEELTRLMIQDKMITAGMGGVLSEQADPTVFRRVLDIGCGTGGWSIEAAKTYPMMSLVGIDISQRMIKYARTQAEAYQVNDRVEFRVMDGLQTLDFPVASFDLVSLRFGTSFVRTWDWPKMLGELLRVTRPSGVVRVTESEVSQQSTSPALMRYFEMLEYALFRGGHLFTQELAGLTSQLTRLLNRYGLEQVQTKTYAFEYRPGTPEQEAFCGNVRLALRTTRPFIQKWGGIPKDYEAICRQASNEMQGPDFHATWRLLTAWGSKP